MTESLEEIGAKAKAKRYAEMASAAAGANDRVKGLEETLAASEYARLLAEQQLETIDWPEGLGEVFHVGTDEPGEDVQAIMDLYDGQVYRRSGNDWVRAEYPSDNIRMAWPIGDAGPFLKLRSAGYLDELVGTVSAANTVSSRLERALHSRPGYRDPDRGTSRWAKPEPVDATIRVIHHLDTERAREQREVASLEQQLSAANQVITNHSTTIQRLQDQVEELEAGQQRNLA